MKLTKQFNFFFHSEQSGGVLLIVVTLLSLLLANSSLQNAYISIWTYPVFGHAITHWINDGLMAIFFLLIGLELKRELLTGELSNLQSASLPLVAAIGGMCVPALIFFLLNAGQPMHRGVGVPMATDIAFAIGVLSLLGSRVPASLKVFLTALAVIDDLGAILVIAIFYSNTLVWTNLGIAFLFFAGLLFCNKYGVRYLSVYLIAGVFMWYFMLNSGIHASVTGVLLACTIPFRKKGSGCLSSKLENYLHKPVAFLILPVFAAANTAIVIHSGWSSGLLSLGCLGIMLGLVVGKPLGIFLFSWISSVLGICRLPVDLKWKHIVSVGVLAGIGFTMSIFITLLAFDDAGYIEMSKIAIMIASFVAGISGYVFLRKSLN